MIIYFSGTGNSRFVAERIAADIGDQLYNAASAIRQGRGGVFTQKGDYVFAAPVYAAAPPLIFMDFIRRSQFPAGSRAYFVMVCAGDMGGSPAYCRRLAKEKGLAYCGTVKVDMPQNYVAYFRVDTPQKSASIIRAALPVIDRAADDIRAGRAFPELAVKAWVRLLTPIVLKPYYKLFVSAKAFAATDKCVGCGKCASVCPLLNITLDGGKPIWGSRCTHCMACINLCPAEAIEYGKRTQGRLRYHGPYSLK